MRRKSERTGKKTKSTPEKKIEKPKRTRTSRRKKQSSSSEHESDQQTSPVRVEPAETVEKKSPVKPAVVKEDSPEEKQDQVWQVKAAEGSGDTGEIQKLKICLARPPSTPERVDKSPRSKRKHSRTTSSSDSPSVEVIDEKKKKHRSKRATRESKDELDKTQDCQGDEAEQDEQSIPGNEEKVGGYQSEGVGDNIPMSTTSDEVKYQSSITKEIVDSDNIVADTTVDSSIEDIQVSQTEINVVSGSEENNVKSKSELDKAVVSEVKSQSTEDEFSKSKGEVTISNDKTQEGKQVIKKNVESHEKGIEHIETGQSKIVEVNEVQTNVTTEKSQDTKEESTNISEHTRERKESVNLTNDKEFKNVDSSHKEIPNLNDANKDSAHDKVRECNSVVDSVHSKEEAVENNQPCTLVINRKRKWGSRPHKLTTQKSITISTDVLKDIIPDVKPVEFDEVMEQKKYDREMERVDRPILPKIVIDNTNHADYKKKSSENNENNHDVKESLPLSNRKISIVKEDEDSLLKKPPSPPRHKSSCILFINNLVRPFTLPQLKNLLQRTGKIVENGFWIDRIKSKCYVIYETEDQAFETRHALHGVTWPVSNPKTLQVDFSTQEAFDQAKNNEENSENVASAIPGTVEDWLREQDMKREKGELEKPWDRKNPVREWDVGKGDKDKERPRRDDQRPVERRRHRSSERSPEPAKKFKKKEEEAPAKLLDDLFRKTKSTPCIYWLPLSAETIAVKEEQRRQHMLEHERRLQEMRRHRRH